MPLPLDSAKTIIDCLEHYAATRGDEPAYIFVSDGDCQEHPITYRQLCYRAKKLALELRDRNLSGLTVLLLFPTGLEFIVAFLACLYSGAIAVPANLARNSHHFERLRRIILDSGAKAVLITPAFKELTRKGLAAAGVDLSGIELVCEDAGEEPTPNDIANLPLNAGSVDAESIAFVQYTSGSTGSPKGVVVSQSQLVANERAIQKTADFPEFMVGAGWLPQFHDMGLIGNLLQPLALGGTYIFMPPLHFIQAPLRWMNLLSRYKAIASAAPNFGLDMCVKALKSAGEQSWDLSQVSTIFCGAEPIRHTTLQQFNEAFGRYGLNASAVKPCYGMAETTLIIAGHRHRSESAAKSLNVDRAMLRQGAVALSSSDETVSQKIVCCGQAVEEHTVAIVNPETGEALEDNLIGEVWCTGPSIASGYWNNAHATQAMFRAITPSGKGPFLRTGDLGFLRNGELYITGRIKEMMIIRGKNYYPHDIETTVAEVFERIGLDVQVAVFSDDGALPEPGLMAYIELPRKAGAMDEAELQPLLRTVRQAVSEIHGVPLKDMLVVKHGAIPRTSSGKIQRTLCADLYRSGNLLAKDKVVYPAGLATV